ncbi:hypothetical protein JA9_005015 [Meyerozyma sp. JA9]|nr:hypothetical protein JA9_005015 [Meyerozyma sp. JA9]
MKRSTKRVFSAVYRILQLAFSMGALGVSAAGVYFNGGWDRGNYAIAVGAMSCLYLMATLMLYKFFTAPIALACDSIAFLLWLISFALITHVWSGADCSYDFSYWYYYYYIYIDWGKICHLYMVLIGLGAANWALYLASIFCIARLASKDRTSSRPLAVGVLSFANDDPANDMEADAAVNRQETGPTTEAPPPSGSVTLAANDVSQPEEEAKLN